MWAAVATSGLAVDAVWEYAVQVSATVQVSPPQIVLSWPQDVIGVPNSYTVYRKAPGAASSPPPHPVVTATIKAMIQIQASRARVIRSPLVDNGGAFRMPEVLAKVAEEIGRHSFEQWRSLSTTSRV